MRLQVKRALCRLGIALVFLRLVALAAPVRAAEGPYLELDTKGHMALIRSLVFTRDGSELVSASDDKTIRVWETDTGRLKRTIRGEIDEGDPGKIYAVALLRDGRLLAAAGTLGKGNPIRLYDFRSGELVGLLKGHDDAVLSLDFSPDGSELVSGGVDDTAIIWDVSRRPRSHGLPATLAMSTPRASPMTALQWSPRAMTTRSSSGGQATEHCSTR